MVLLLQQHLVLSLHVMLSLQSIVLPFEQNLVLVPPLLEMFQHLVLPKKLLLLNPLILELLLGVSVHLSVFSCTCWAEDA